MLSIGGMTTTTHNSRAGPTRGSLARRQLREARGMVGSVGRPPLPAVLAGLGWLGTSPSPTCYMLFLRMSAC